MFWDSLLVDCAATQVMKTNAAKVVDLLEIMVTMLLNGMSGRLRLGWNVRVEVNGRVKDI